MNDDCLFLCVVGVFFLRVCVFTKTHIFHIINILVTILSENVILKICCFTVGGSLLFLAVSIQVTGFASTHAAPYPQLPVELQRAVSLQGHSLSLLLLLISIVFLFFCFTNEINKPIEIIS